MNSISERPPLPATRTYWLQGRSPLVHAVVLVLTFVALVLSSYATVPMVPVPMTLQTLAVLLAGALLGWRLGMIVIIAWLVLAAAGLPLLSNGGGGVRHFVGPTGGYLVAFPLAAGLVGWLVERGWNGEHAIRALGAFLLGHVVCLLLGGIWLAAAIGPTKAWLHGILPFLLGGVMKSVLGTTVLKVLALRARASAWA
ncbi:Substrate-specific component BioY of biotin ECF transporter [plant metagenome]|uniref:Substrate-specific component BioY of biotin ECF transporter n=1 Tax=plant metagenome TaxID=1297885 RepID=A0A484SBL2_9ZZZZ